MEPLQEILSRALGQGEEGDFEGMSATLRDALEDDPDDPYILCWLGVAERELGMDGIAYERFRRSLANEPEDPHVLATVGNALAAFDDPDAEGALRSAAVLGPELSLARWMYGAYLSREGLLDDAFRELDAAVELAPEEAVVHIERGVAWALRGDFSSSADAFARAVELDREDGWARILLGLALVEDDRLDDGVADLIEGAHLRPEDIEAQVLAALAAAAGGYEDQALELIERARIDAVGADEGIIAEADERITAGPDEARRFLTTSLGPSILRERLMVRP